MTVTLLAGIGRGIEVHEMDEKIVGSLLTGWNSGRRRMKLNQLPGNVNLTYCTNIHAGESWPDIRASLDAHVPAIKSAVAPDRPLGIGLRLSGQAAAVARQPEALASFREQLATLGAYVFTINAFPFGPFHGVRVKEQVYLPDWRSPERVAFTANSAAVLAAVLPDGIDGSISTVPGAFKPNGQSSEAVAAMAANMIMAVADLVDGAPDRQAHRARAGAGALLLP